MKLFAFTLSFLGICCSAFAGETLTYVSITEGKKTTTEWSVEAKNGSLDITSKNSDNSIVTLQTKENYDLISFVQKDENKGYDWKAARDGSKLSLSGMINKSMQTKTYDIADAPWVQEFTFGFKDFLESSKREYKFEIIRAEDFALHDMIATKLDIEDLTINDKTYTAQKMKITLQGFKKRFWKAEVWYDIKTKVMLRYRANEGPGTPITDVILTGSSS